MRTWFALAGSIAMRKAAGSVRTAAASAEVDRGVALAGAPGGAAVGAHVDPRSAGGAAVVERCGIQPIGVGRIDLDVQVTVGTWPSRCVQVTPLSTLRKMPPHSLAA